MQLFICGFSISKNYLSNIQKKFKRKRGFLVWLVVSTTWSCGKTSFFLNFFVLERSFFFEHRKTTNEGMHLPQTCLSVKKAALRSGNVRFSFSLIGKKAKKVSKSPRSSSSWSVFSYFYISAGFSLSWLVGNISLYLATETFPTGNHQCKSWSQLKRQQTHKVRCSKTRAAGLKRCKCCCNLTAVLFWRKSFFRVLVHEHAHSVS